MERRDGSVQSYNTPTKKNLYQNQDPEFSIYRCMVIGVHYIDDKSNITLNSTSPQVTYDVIVLGGPNEGAIIDNVRAAGFLGGDKNYSERIFKAATFDTAKQQLQKQDGDIVFVGFMGGAKTAPFILGGGTQPLDGDKTGARKAEGPRARMEYNGIFIEIDRTGNLVVRRKGGSLNSTTNTFSPNDAGDKLSITISEQKAIINTESGAKLTVDGASDVILSEDKAGGKIKVSGGKIAAGTSSVELLQQISDELEKLITLFTTVAPHKHIGNLGFFSFPPDTEAAWTTAASSLTTIKSNIDSIKGNI